VRPLDLSGKTALVTGGNRGIGLAVVRELARAGARVTFTARSMDKINEALRQLDGLEARGIVHNVADLMPLIVSADFDILINNAGVIGPIGRINEVSIHDWAMNIQTNLIGAFHTVQLVLPSMVARGGGTIVNLSSGAARNAMEGWSAYCSGKAGLAMLTQCVAKEYGDRGIRAFGFAPGVVDTEMQGAIRASGINPVSQIPRGNLAPPEEPAWAIAWLCTPEADLFAGQEVDVRHEPFRRAAGLEIRA
jgi:NAD(P)-dependent dehydrogenase (short-subunit alcohol dehydrogenase family)